MAGIICPKCKTENSLTNQFCKGCGSSLVGVAAASAAPVPPPPPPSGGMYPPPPQGAPQVQPQPAYGQPQAQPYQAPYVYGTPMSTLGVRSDGWSDVVEGGSPLMEAVKNDFLAEIRSSNLPGLNMAEANLTCGAGESRPYQILQNGKGATVAVRIAPYGRDLTVSWDLFTRKSINWLTIGLLGGGVLLFAVLYVLINGYYGSGFFEELFGMINMFLNLLLVPGLFIMLLGKMLKDDWMAYYVNDLNPFAMDDAINLTTIVDRSLSKAIESAQEAAEKKKK